MKEKEKGMQLPKISVDDIFFSNKEQREDEDKEKVEILKIKDISNFPNHPFKIYDKIENGIIVDKEMRNMVESVKKNGVIMPIIVRPKEDGGYEVISGHRRKRASELAGLKEIKAIIRNMTDDEATISMVDSNNQREKVLPSEKAFAYKMKLDALKHQGKREDLTSDPMGPKSERSNKLLADEVDESITQIKRYIRLTELIPELLELVDKEKNGIALRPAVEISYLKEDEQYSLLDTIECLQVTPSHAQAIVMRKRSTEGTLTADKIEEIMEQEKANQIPKIKLNEDRFNKILPTNLKSAKEKEDYIYHCVEETRKRELRNKEYTR